MLGRWQSVTVHDDSSSTRDATSVEGPSEEVLQLMKGLTGYTCTASGKGDCWLIGGHKTPSSLRPLTHSALTTFGLPSQKAFRLRFRLPLSHAPLHVTSNSRTPVECCIQEYDLPVTLCEHTAVCGTRDAVQTEDTVEDSSLLFNGLRDVLRGRAILIFGGSDGIASGTNRCHLAYLPEASDDEEDSAGRIMRFALDLPLGGCTPPTRRRHAATLADSRMFVFGGMSPSGKLLNDLFFLDCCTGLWHSLDHKTFFGRGPSPRMCATLVYVRTSEVEEGDPRQCDRGESENRENSRKPDSISDGLDGFLFILRGQGRTQLHADAYRLSLATHRWVQGRVRSMASQVSQLLAASPKQAGGTKVLLPDRKENLPKSKETAVKKGAEKTTAPSQLFTSTSTPSSAWLRSDPGLAVIVKGANAELRKIVGTKGQANSLNLKLQVGFPLCNSTLVSSHPLDPMWSLEEKERMVEESPDAGDVTAAHGLRFEVSPVRISPGIVNPVGEGTTGDSTEELWLAVSTHPQLSLWVQGANTDATNSNLRMPKEASERNIGEDGSSTMELPLASGDGEDVVDALDAAEDQTDPALIVNSALPFYRCSDIWLTVMEFLLPTEIVLCSLVCYNSWEAASDEYLWSLVEGRSRTGASAALPAPSAQERFVGWSTLPPSVRVRHSQLVQRSLLSAMRAGNRCTLDAWGRDNPNAAPTSLITDRTPHAVVQFAVAERTAVFVLPDRLVLIPPKGSTVLHNTASCLEALNQDSSRSAGKARGSGSKASSSPADFRSALSLSTKKIALFKQNQPGPVPAPTPASTVSASAETSTPLLERQSSQVSIASRTSASSAMTRGTTATSLATNAQPIEPLPPLNAYSISVNPIHRASQFAAATEDKLITIVDSLSGRVENVLKGHTRTVNRMKFYYGQSPVAASSSASPSSSVFDRFAWTTGALQLGKAPFLLSSGMDNVIKLWDLRRSRYRPSPPETASLLTLGPFRLTPRILCTPDPVVHPSVAPLLLSVSVSFQQQPAEILVHDLGSGTLAHTWTGIGKTVHTVESAFWLNQDEFLMKGDSGMDIYDLRSGSTAVVLTPSLAPGAGAAGRRAKCLDVAPFAILSGSTNVNSNYVLMSTQAVVDPSMESSALVIADRRKPTGPVATLSTRPYWNPQEILHLGEGWFAVGVEGGVALTRVHLGNGTFFALPTDFIGIGGATSPPAAPGASGASSPSSKMGLGLLLDTKGSPAGNMQLQEYWDPVLHTARARLFAESGNALFCCDLAQPGTVSVSSSTAKVPTRTTSRTSVSSGAKAGAGNQPPPQRLALSHKVMKVNIL